MDKKSFFLVLDGIDGSGTTTHSKMLVSYLEMLGLKVYLTQEPSKNEIGLLLRQYLKNNEIPPSTDALLFAADRDLHYKKEIKPKLDQGFIVVSDRYIESSIIYQSVQSDEITIEWIKQINKFARLPDLTIILDIDPKISLARKSQEILEKFEDTKFLDKVRTLYLDRAKAEGYHIVNTNDIIEIVQQEIQTIVIKKLKEKGF
ncbi:MAG: dTMP kinase [Candidatus Lokiarchaeota archaeon]|nr:dTMP kinase [Candidatus Lokiarchaeota archaeon]